MQAIMCDWCQRCDPLRRVQGHPEARVLPAGWIQTFPQPEDVLNNPDPERLQFCSFRCEGLYALKRSDLDEKEASAGTTPVQLFAGQLIDTSSAVNVRWDGSKVKPEPNTVQFPESDG